MLFTASKMIYERHGNIRASIRDYLRREPAKWKHQPGDGQIGIFCYDNYQLEKQNWILRYQ